MTTPLSSYNEKLPDDVLLESGVVYIGSSIFAATDGGIKFDPGKSTRDVQFDGMRSKIKGLTRTIGFDAKISGVAVQLGPTLIPQIEPGATAVSLSGAPAGFTTGYQPKQAGVLYAVGDYLSAPRCIWQRGNGTYVQVRFYDGGFVDKWDAAGTDKQEVKTTFEICSVLDMSVTGRKTSDCPYVIEYFATAP